ncbi:MAG: hypothetical protein AAFO69_16535 [Bacteroidota bacterium]
METLDTTEDFLKLDKFLGKYGYHIASDEEDIFRIERKQPISRFVILLVFILGIGVAILSFIIEEYRLSILGCVMILFPLINRGWRYPLAIVIDRVEHFLTIERGVLFKTYKLFEMDHINEIAVHRVSKATEVNPFTDGDKEHVYIFSMLQNEKSHQLMRLVSRKNIDKNAKSFSSYLNRMIRS